MTTFCIPGRIELGDNSVGKAGGILKALGSKKPIVVMDAFLASPAIAMDKKITAMLNEDQLTPCFYTGIKNEPSSDNVAEALRVIAEHGADGVLAVGGGSSLDVAKAIAVKAVNPDLAFADIPKSPSLKRLPFVAVPTTAGTGSEATKVSVITNAQTGIKENPGHPGMLPDAAILDPRLTMSLPADLTAFTGMDALTHAMEAYVSTNANPLSDTFALKAMELVGKYLAIAVADGKNVEAREQMALASCFAGVAFSNASTNLAHAGGRALGAYFHIPHGLSVSLLLPFVMEFGLAAAEERYAAVAAALGEDPRQSQKELAQKAVAKVYAYNDQFGIWAATKERYVKDIEAFKAAVPEMTKNALSGNGILTNRIVPNEQDVETVFHKLIQKIS